MGRIGKFIKDAGRRWVLPNAALYIVAAWVAIQVADLDSIRDEVEFHTMLEEIKADMAAQLGRVRAMEEAGELEPVPDIN